MEQERYCYYQALMGVLPACDEGCLACRFYLNEEELDNIMDAAKARYKEFSEFSDNLKAVIAKQIKEKRKERGN